MEQCFYCDNQIGEDTYTHYVSFVQSTDFVEKTLCMDCYKEWLEGIKE
ncbi:hypothetical protein [Evansella tamaricis]|uniref:Small CPxCG-related zinc finger protein n=1 Tax=Evansella tamaricis TaxID=2069301 RepID=A0ABS6JK77_9BACI|nr:hypothetical protein [Evansella tamaricis]MBU9713790.1 hypothetical protein [Evansella tamaricis]